MKLSTLLWSVDFLSELGVGIILRKAATCSTPTMEITKNGDKWKIVTKTILKSVELNFELGVPFEEVSTDGRKCKTTVTMEGDNKLITNQVATEEGKKSVKVIREFSDEGIDVQMICGDVVSKQFFKRQ
jgi:hypothetical protein